AVLLTVSARNATVRPASGVRVWPSGGPRPADPSFTVPPGSTVVTSVLVPVGRGGAVSLTATAARSPQLAVTVSAAGYLRAGTSAAGGTYAVPAAVRLVLGGRTAPLRPRT